MEGRKSNNRNILYYSESFSVGRAEKKGGGVLISGVIFMKTRWEN